MSNKHIACARRGLGLAIGWIALLTAAVGCAPDPSSDGHEEDSAVAEEERVGAAQEAARTPGALAKYYHTTTSQGLAFQADYTTWSADWHTITQASADNQLFFYNRNDGTAKVYTLDSAGALSFQSQTGLVPGIDVWIRGNFTGTSAKDLAGYDRAAGFLYVFEVSSAGALTYKFGQTLPANCSFGFSGNWGNPGRDDLVLYNKSEGLLRFYTSNGTSSFTLARAANTSKIWDHIVPGRFNTDSITDLLYYNQDSGEYKLLLMNTSRSDTLSDSGTTLPTAPGASDNPVTPFGIFVTGEFGGSTQTDDILFYDQRAGTGRFLLSSTTGVLSAGSRLTGWQKKWTHITPVRQPLSTTSDLLFYSNSYDIDVVVARFSMDGAGTGAPQLTTGQFQRWLDVANETYRAAGVQLVWDGQIQEIQDPWMQTYTCITDPEWLKEQADYYATTLGAPFKVVVLVRNNGPKGCASMAHQYVMMPGWNLTSTQYRTRFGLTLDDNGNLLPPDTWTQNNLKIFAHELGHYLGLDHPDKTVSAPATIYGFDRDMATVDFTAVFDTPPTPEKADWPLANEDLCDDGVEVPVTLSSGSATLNPERHNVMLNGVNCDYTYRLSPGQIDAVRANLNSNRAALLQ